MPHATATEEERIDREANAEEFFDASGLHPFVAALLAEQTRLETPAARFARRHDTGKNAAAGATVAPNPARAAQLIPLTAPAPGEQYAFEVDLDSCTGCKSCVAACHALNGLDDDETWRDVGLLISEDPRRPYTQTVTTACHHCEDPACMNGCPVLAYEKDPLTGIVRHLDDQCIGCSYCVLKCPYDVPKYSRRLGIVRKCDLCHGRLSHGEPPACAQACPTQAIRIVTRRTADDIGHSRRPPAPGVRDSRKPATRADRRDAAFLPGAPDPSFTRPTTRYVSRRGLPAGLVAGDRASVSPQPPHWPLAVMLTLMALATGSGVIVAAMLLGPVWLRTACGFAASPGRRLAVIAFLGAGAGSAGLLASVFHLGQPIRAWRIFLGLRRSWLSREALGFGTWLPFAWVLAFRLAWPAAWRAAATAELAAAVAALAVGGLFCSVMIYADTHRLFWRRAHTAPRFFGGAAVLGLCAAIAVGAPGAPNLFPGPAILLAAAVLAKLALEAQARKTPQRGSDPFGPAAGTARLLAGPLHGVDQARIGCAVLGGILAPIVLALGPAPGWIAGAAAAAVFTGELLERSLFFRAVDASRMPGVPG